jgi:acyl carrier protein
VGAVVLAIAVAIAEQLLVGLEKEFGIQIPDADAQTVHTIRDIVEYLDRRGVSP